MPYITALQQKVMDYSNALLLERVPPNTGTGYDCYYSKGETPNLSH